MARRPAAQADAGGGVIQPPQGQLLLTCQRRRLGAARLAMVPPRVVGISDHGRVSGPDNLPSALGASGGGDERFS